MTDKQERVYLVATGETVDGRETYTRHDSLPPMCDFETLFSAPPAQPADDIHSCSYYCDRPACVKRQRDELRDAQPAPAQEPQPVSNTDELPQRLSDEMDAIAIKHAHKMALDLECILAEYGGSWYNTAMQTLGEYRSEMNAIHERESPTFMGEPLIAAAPKGQS